MFLNMGYELTGSIERPLEVLRQASRMLGADLTEKPLQAVGCSGVLAAMEDGTVVHGRNLDYTGFEMEANGKTLHWPDITVDVLFVKGGKPFITSTHWPGFIGFTTAMRFGGWSFEQNTRFHGVGESVLYGLLRHSKGFELTSRRIMETTPDFETAVQRLYESNMMAPGYFVVAGTGPFEGAVITVDRGGHHLQGTPPVLRLSRDRTVLRGEELGWHLVQTNDDHFKDALDQRRPDEELRLTSARQGSVGTEWMWSEMLGSALYRNETVYTTVYVPKTGYHKTYAHPENAR